MTTSDNGEYVGSSYIPILPLLQSGGQSKEYDVSQNEGHLGSPSLFGVPNMKGCGILKSILGSFFLVTTIWVALRYLGPGLYYGITATNIF